MRQVEGPRSSLGEKVLKALFVILFVGAIAAYFVTPHQKHRWEVTSGNTAIGIKK